MKSATNRPALGRGTMTSVQRKGGSFFLPKLKKDVMGIYRELQEALEQQLSHLAQLPELKGPKLQRLIYKLRTNRFNLVVLGAFKRGKSTLINALLGEAVLPTAIVPLTSVVTILGYGEQLDI